MSPASTLTPKVGQTPRLRKRPSLLSQNSIASQAAGDERQLEALVSTNAGAWAGSHAVEATTSMKAGFEGVEPEELLTGLCPRSDRPPCEKIQDHNLKEVENVIVDCDGLLFNIEESEGPKACAASYERKNVEFLNTLSEAGKRLIFCDSGSAQSRESFQEQLRRKGISQENCKVWTPASAAAWYLKSRGFVKPLIVSTQVSFVQEVKDLGFDCLSVLDQEGQLIDELSVPDTSADEEHLDAALKLLASADAVVIGPLKDVSALLTALVDSILDLPSELAGPKLVCCCPTRTRRKMKIMRTSVAGQRLSRGTTHEDFVDTQFPSVMVSAALLDTQGFKPGETLMIGRSFEKTARFAYRAGMQSLLILDTLMDQLQLTKETRTECLPDYVAPSLGHIMG